MGSVRNNFLFQYLLLYACLAYLSHASNNPQSSIIRNIGQNVTEDLLEISNTMAEAGVTSLLQSNTGTEAYQGSTPSKPKILNNNASLAPAKVRGLYKLSITSDRDYNSFMASVPPHKDVWLNIQVWDPTDWTLNAVLTNTDRIKRLHIGGNIDMEKISDILNQTKKVTHLVLSNKSRRLCSYNEIGTKKLVQTYLNSTEIIILEHFTNICENLYSGFLLNLELPNLHGLALKNSVLNYRNVVWIRKFLVDQWKTLTHIKFKNTRIETLETFFDTESVVVLRFVKNVHLDFISNFVSREFCDVMPGVQTITSINGYMFAEQVQHLAKCKELSSIRFSIKLISSTTFDMGIFARHSSLQQKINITLLHERCDSSLVARNNKLLVLENLNLLDHPAKDITIYSNCKLKVLFQSTSSKTSEWDTVSFHFYAGFYTNRSNK